MKQMISQSRTLIFTHHGCVFNLTSDQNTKRRKQETLYLIITFLQTWSQWDITHRGKSVVIATQDTADTNANQDQ